MNIENLIRFLPVFFVILNLFRRQSNMGFFRTVLSAVVLTGSLLISINTEYFKENPLLIIVIIFIDILANTVGKTLDNTNIWYVKKYLNDTEIELILWNPNWKNLNMNREGFLIYGENVKNVEIIDTNQSFLDCKLNSTGNCINFNFWQFNFWQFPSRSFVKIKAENAESVICGVQGVEVNDYSGWLIYGKKSWIENWDIKWSRWVVMAISVLGIAYGTNYFKNFSAFDYSNIVIIVLSMVGIWLSGYAIVFGLFGELFRKWTIPPCIREEVLQVIDENIQAYRTKNSNNSDNK